MACAKMRKAFLKLGTPIRATGTEIHIFVIVCSLSVHLLCLDSHTDTSTERFILESVTLSRVGESEQSLTFTFP
eukprot:2516351-Heterocapsa_arctica.AAC.1